MQEHKRILQKVQDLKKKIDTKEFCKLHGISESKFSRFPSEKFIKELELIDYMQQFYDFTSYQGKYGELKTNINKQIQMEKFNIENQYKLYLQRMKLDENKRKFNIKISNK